MDCGASFKDFLRYPNKPTHDGVARCEACERCYENITVLTQWSYEINKKNKKYKKNIKYKI